MCNIHTSVDVSGGRSLAALKRSCTEQSPQKHLSIRTKYCLILNFEEIFRHCVKKSSREGDSKKALRLYDSNRMLIDIATMGNSMEVPKKIKVEAS